MDKVIKLDPQEINDNWEKFIKMSILASLPPQAQGSENAGDYILTALNQDRMHCWLGFQDGEVKKPIFVATTMFVGEPGLEVRNLLIYSLFGLTEIIPDLARLGYETIKAFAKRNQCHKIIGYTNINSIVERVQMLGGKAEYVVVTLEV